MSGLYRSNVVQPTTSQAATFDPPLDGLYVITAPATSVVITVAGASVTFTAAMLTVGSLLGVCQITAVASNSAFTYIGLREKVNGTITDDLNA